MPQGEVNGAQLPSLSHCCHIAFCPFVVCPYAQPLHVFKFIPNVKSTDHVNSDILQFLFVLFYD